MYLVEVFRVVGRDLLFRTVYRGPDPAEAVATADTFRRAGHGYLITTESGSVIDGAVSRIGAAA